MSDLDVLVAQLRAEVADAREDLGLAELDLNTPEELLAEAERLSELVRTRMSTIEDQLGALDVTRSAAHGYLAGEAVR